MSTTVSPVQEAHDLLQGRLTELDSERDQIQRALAELPVNGNGPTATRSTRIRVPRQAPKGTTKRPAGRKRSGGRADQTVALVEKHKDGINASEVAKALKMKPNYLYRVLAGLEKEGRIRKEGKKYLPAA